jgi:hypothetical protein
LCWWLVEGVALESWAYIVALESWAYKVALESWAYKLTNFLGRYTRSNLFKSVERVDVEIFQKHAVVVFIETDVGKIYNGGAERRSVAGNDSSS